MSAQAAGEVLAAVRVCVGFDRFHQVTGNHLRQNLLKSAHERESGRDPASLHSLDLKMFAGRCRGAL
jgi:hypothetical protein